MKISTHHQARIIVGALLLSQCDSASAVVRKDVQFSQGEMSAQFEGTVSTADHDRFFLVAKSGQQLRLQLQSSSGNGVFSLYGPGYVEESNGFVAGKSMQYEATAARVVVFANGTHLINVSSLGGTTTYRMIATLDGASETGSTPAGGTTVTALPNAGSNGETKNGSVNSEPNPITVANTSVSSVEQTGVASVAPSVKDDRDQNTKWDAHVLSTPPTIVEPKSEATAKPVSLANGDSTNGFFRGLWRGVRNIVNALGSLLLACGVLASCVAGIQMPRPDRRFKTGYKDNAVVTWQFRAVAIGTAVGAAGLLLSSFSA